MILNITDFAAHKVEPKDVPDALIRTFLEKILAMSLGSMTANLDSVGYLTQCLRRDMLQQAKPVELTTRTTDPFDPIPGTTPPPAGHEWVAVPVEHVEAVADLVKA